MAIYRARPEDGVAWVTGASSGIGRAVASALARKGYTVAATARSDEGLEGLAAEYDHPEGRIVPMPCDVRDEAAMAATVEAIERDVGPIVLAVFNAGVSWPTQGERLETENFVKTYQTNVFGVIFGLIPVVHRMQQRGHGQIAIVGSVAGYLGLPSSAAYGSTKAALHHLAESLRFDFEKMNIRIQIINPGFVKTPLTARFSFPMPALMGVGRASRRLVRALNHGGFETTFPRKLTWAMKFIRLWPQPLVFWFLNRVTGWKTKPLEPREPAADS